MGYVPIKQFSNTIPTPELGQGISDDNFFGGIGSTGNSGTNQDQSNRNKAKARTTPNQKIRRYQDVDYTPTRGILAPKDFKNVQTEVLYFQFNPSEIQDVKTTDWLSKTYVGFSGVDYMWTKGGDRTISFKLFMDATASSNTPRFGHNVQYGSQTQDTLNKTFPRGVMDMVDKLTRFMYPIQEDSDKPQYSNGGIIPTTRFMPPPIAVFVFGDLYLEGIVSDVSTTHLLFDKDLISRRCECQVKFKVIETAVVVKDKRLNPPAARAILNSERGER